MASGDLHLFLDVNVYLDAFIAWNDDQRPTVLYTGDGVLAGDPPCMILTAIREHLTVRAQSLVLHTSDRVLELVAAKLIADYGWEDHMAALATDWILETVDVSGGYVAPTQAVPAEVPGLLDLEDRHRIAEARAVHAELFLTRDGEIVAAADPYARPFPMTPWHFVQRSKMKSG